MEQIVGIVGAGVMGIGIAKSFAGWCNVILCDKREINKDSLMGFDIKFTTNLKDLAFCSVVIEAIFEDYNSKVALYNNLQNIIKNDAMVCSNTSSLYINELSKTFANPERFLGMHFMNPAHKNDLVEIIPSSSTDIFYIDMAENLLTSIGKTTIVAKDSPGFIVNRILIPMINDAINLLHEGVASKEDLDRAMSVAAKHPIGPLALADMIGLDIILNIMRNLYKELKSDRYKPSVLLEEMVDKNLLGKKTRHGFYEYE